MHQVPGHIYIFDYQKQIKEMVVNFTERLYCFLDEVDSAVFVGDRDLIYFDIAEAQGKRYIQIYTTMQIFDLYLNKVPPITVIKNQLLTLNKLKIMALPRFKVDYANGYATQDQIIKVEGKVSEVIQIQMSTDAKQNEYLEKVYTSLNENGNADSILASAVAEYAVKNQEAVKNLHETLLGLASKQEGIVEDITGFYEDTKAGFTAIQGTRVTTL